jgi:hypothetical protein
MKTKAELLVRKMKADPNIAWSEKGELKYKGETVRGSNVVDLVNDVLRVSTSVLKVDPVLDFFPSVSWCFWGVRSNRGGTLLSLAFRKL